MHNKLLLIAIRIGAVASALLTAAVRMLAGTTFWGLTRRAWSSLTDKMPAHGAVVLIHDNSPYALQTVLVLLGGPVLVLLSLAPAASARNGTHHWVWNKLNFHNASSELTVYSNPPERYAWGTNVGWINFNPTNGGVRLYSDHMEGYAWGENIGWIRLGTCTGGSPCTHANTSANNYGINHDGAGNLSGYAWGTTIGWINFNPAHGGVRVDLATGSFSGYAWGENIGWIRFQSSRPANTHTILVSADPPASGTVSGSGTVNHGTTATVTATANTGYTFVHWTEGGTPVSASATYSFTATADRTLVATFVALPVAVNDAAGTLQGNPVEIALLANDFDPAAGGLIVQNVSQPTQGRVAVNVGAQTVTYIPDPTHSGLDSFRYIAEDANGNRNEATVAVVVAERSATNHAPQVTPVNPMQPGSAVFTDTHTTALLETAAGIYTGTLEAKEIFFLAYTPIITPTGDVNAGANGFKFSNFAFHLEAFLNGSRLLNFQFGRPVTLTLVYDPATPARQVEGSPVTEDRNRTTWTNDSPLTARPSLFLVVYSWNGTAWTNDGITVVSHDTSNHVITLLLTHPGEFAFFTNVPMALEPGEEPEYPVAHLFLPVVVQDMVQDSVVTPRAAEEAVYLYLPVVEK